MNRRRAIVLAGLGVSAAAGAVLTIRDDLFEKRVAVVRAGRLVRGAWQRPWPLKRLIARERIRTIVTLTAINRDDPKYVAQKRVIDETGVAWVFVPMRGSRATLAQMAEAADLLADPARQPVYFHCVAGHHRTSLVHAAYRIRHEGWSAEQAWDEVASLPWARPRLDLADRRLIDAFAAAQEQNQDAHDTSRRRTAHARTPDPEVAPSPDPHRRSDRGDLRGRADRAGQPRRGDAGAGLSLGPDARRQARPGDS